MKHLFLVFTLIIANLSLFSFNAYAKVEQSNIVVSKELEDSIKKIITISGYSCKKIDSVLLKHNGDFRVVCNDWDYAYLIKDKGGNWVVVLD